MEKLKHEKYQRFNDMFVCEPCNVEAYSKCEFQLHLTYDGDVKYKCDECFKIFAAKSNLKQY